MYAGQVSGQPIASAPKEMPVFHRVFDNLTKSIASGHEAANRIEGVIDRLLNSQPRPVPPDGAKVNPATVEAKMGEAVSGLEELTSRLHELADRLERAA